MVYYISKIRQHTILICMSFSIKSTTTNSHVKRKLETEVDLCAILAKNGRKSPEIVPRFANLRPPRTRGASAMPPAPARRSDSDYAECIVVIFVYCMQNIL